MTKEIVPTTSVAHVRSTERRSNPDWEAQADYSNDPGINIPAHLLHSDKEYRWIRYKIAEQDNEPYDLDNLKEARDAGFTPALLSEHPGIKDYHCYKFEKECILYQGLMLACRPKMRTYMGNELPGNNEPISQLDELPDMSVFKKLLS